MARHLFLIHGGTGDDPDDRYTERELARRATPPALCAPPASATATPTRTCSSSTTPTPAATRRGLTREATTDEVPLDDPRRRDAWDALTADEQQAARQRYAAFAAAAQERGALLRAGELQSTASATTVRVEDGTTLVTDGPYAETREVLGGFFLVDAQSLDDAVELAKQLPAPHGRGGIEIRPVYQEEDDVVNYLLLIYSDPSRAAGMTPEEIQASRAEVMPEWIALFDYLGTHATSVEGFELDDPETAKTLRYEDGRAVVTDGPFAETKELIGGLFIVDCKDLDEAIDMAARVPIAARGSVEIRPLVEQEAGA